MEEDFFAHNYYSCGLPLFEYGTRPPLLNGEEDVILPVVREAAEQFHEQQKSLGKAMLYLSRVGLYRQNLLYILQNWESGSGLVLERCRIKDITEIVNFLNRQPEDARRSCFSLRGNPLDRDGHGITSLLEALRYARIEQIDLSGGTLLNHDPSRFDDEQTIPRIKLALHDLVAHSPCLETLILSDNTMPCELTNGLGGGLAGFGCSLQVLQLSSCGMTSEMLRDLLQPISSQKQVSCHLRILILNHNSLSRGSLGTLSRFLGSNGGSSLEELDVSLNQELFRQQASDATSGDWEQLIQSIVSSRSLERWAAIQTGMGGCVLDVLWRQLVRLGHSSRLKYLALSIPPSSVRSLAEHYLPHIRTIREFNCVFQDLSPFRNAGDRLTVLKLWEAAFAKNTSLIHVFPLPWEPCTKEIDRIKSYHRRNRYIWLMEKVLEKCPNSASGSSLWHRAMVRLEAEGGPSAIYTIVQKHFSKLLVLEQDVRPVGQLKEVQRSEATDRREQYG